jgi:hypothetical protein
MDVFVSTGAMPKRYSRLAFRDALVGFIVDLDSPFLMVENDKFRSLLVLLRPDMLC